MYHKLKNTLAALSMVTAFVMGSLLLSEPVPAEVSRPAAAQTQQSETDLALAMLKLALDLAHIQTLNTVRADATDAAHTAEAEAQQRASRVRLELGMPYYSFGAVLPRRRES